MSLLQVFPLRLKSHLSYTWSKRSIRPNSHYTDSHSSVTVCLWSSHGLLMVQSHIITCITMGASTLPGMVKPQSSCTSFNRYLEWTVTRGNTPLWMPPMVLPRSCFGPHREKEVLHLSALNSIFFKNASVYSNVIVKYAFIINQMRKQCMEFSFTLLILQDCVSPYSLYFQLCIFLTFIPHPVQ